MEFLLSDICYMQSGGTPRKNNADFWEGEIPWVTISDFKNIENSVIYKTQETISKKGLRAINNRFFKNGTLLLAMYGSVGKTAILGIDASINQAILGINSKNASILNLKYLKYWLDYNKDFIIYQSKGATLRNVSLSIIQRQKIDLPTLEMQDKIVTILDKVHTIQEKRKKTIQKYDELLQTVFLNMFGDPVINPIGWNKISLEELGKWKSGRTPSRQKQEYFNGNIPWATSGELNEVFISSTKEYITQDAIDNSNAKLIPENNLLLGMYDTAALKSSINTVPLTCNQAIAYSQIDSQKCNLLYLYAALQIGKEYFKSSQRGGRQQNLNLTMIKEISIPNPPIERQEEFEIIYLKYSQLNKKLKDSIEYLNDLFNSLSQLAFKGELEFGQGIDLEILLKNDFTFFKKNGTDKSIQQLIERLDKNELNEYKFHNPEIYDKAKDFVFELLKENKIKQVFDSKTKSVKLKLK